MQNQPGNPFVYPKDVGIVAMDIYFPKTCVSQEELGKVISLDRAVRKFPSAYSLIFVWEYYNYYIFEEFEFKYSF